MESKKATMSLVSNNNEENGMVNVEVKKPTVKTISKSVAVCAVRFDKEDGWALTIGTNVVSPKKFKTVWGAIWEVFKNKRLYREIKIMIMVEQTLDLKLKERKKEAKGAGKGRIS